MGKLFEFFRVIMLEFFSGIGIFWSRLVGRIGIRVLEENRRLVGKFS